MSFKFVCKSLEMMIFGEYCTKIYGEYGEISSSFPIAKHRVEIFCGFQTMLCIVSHRNYVQ